MNNIALNKDEVLLLCDCVFFYTTHITEDNLQCIELLHKLENHLKVVDNCNKSHNNKCICDYYSVINNGCKCGGE